MSMLPSKGKDANIMSTATAQKVHAIRLLKPSFSACQTCVPSYVVCTPDVLDEQSNGYRTWTLQTRQCSR